MQKDLSPITNHLFKKINLSNFLSNFWQKKPLLIKKAFPNFKQLISPEEIAGLSLEEFIDSRLITKEKWKSNTICSKFPIPKDIVLDLKKEEEIIEEYCIIGQNQKVNKNMNEKDKTFLSLCELTENKEKNGY